MYDQLKHRIQQMKLDQEWLLQNKAEQRKVSSRCMLHISAVEVSRAIVPLLPRLKNGLSITFEGCPVYVHCMPQVETAALLQQRMQYEGQLNRQRQELAALQQRLKESVDRATKVRQHSER